MRPESKNTPEEQATSLSSANERAKIRSLYKVLHSISLTSLVMRFAYLEHYGIYSAPPIYTMQI